MKYVRIKAMPKQSIMNRLKIDRAVAQTWTPAGLTLVRCKDEKCKHSNNVSQIIKWSDHDFFHL